MKPIHFPARFFDRDADWPTWLTDEERQHGHGGLYRFYGPNRELLYVGISRELMVRWSAHRNTAKWWTQIAFVAVSYYPSGCPVGSWTAERASIAHEKPAHNKDHANPSSAVALSLLPHVPPPAF